VLLIVPSVLQDETVYRLALFILHAPPVLSQYTFYFQILIMLRGCSIVLMLFHENCMKTHTQNISFEHRGLKGGPGPST